MYFLWQFPSQIVGKSFGVVVVKKVIYTGFYDGRV